METEPKRMGRPPKPDDETRSVRLVLKLTPPEMALIESVAEQPSVWVRDLALRAARRRK